MAASAIPLRRIEGKYEILEKIREGGMGAIYKVRHRLLDEIRVIKLMRQQLIQDEELKSRFLREARMAIKLRHPNIAQLYDFTVDDDGTAFIVMEFIDGTNLEDIVALHGPPPLAFSVEIARQSLRALGYLHTRGFIHRDISPDNLMLTEDADGQPLVKLIDLGLAKTLDNVGDSHLTQTGTFLGKLRYAAPEQFKADGNVDARTDLYAFGVVLYVLLTGKFPIQGQDPSSLVAGHLFRPPLDFAESDPAGLVPAGLRAVVLKLLAKFPEERFASAQELSLVLGDFRTAEGPAPADLKRLLSRPFVAAGSVSRLEHGSTQGRLNESFDLVTTPRPVPLVPLPSPPADDLTVQMPRDETAEARRLEEEKSRELATALAAIAAALARGDYRAAETLLYGAEASLGEQEAFPALYEQVAEQRRAHDTGKVEERLAAGDLDGAEALLAKAAAAHGEEAVETLRERLSDLRRAERRAQGLKNAVAKIRDRLDEGDLHGAGELLDQAVLRFRAVEPLREQYERLEQMRRAAKAAAAAPPAPSLDAGDAGEYFEVTQTIAELLSRREPQRALQALQRAGTRFGDRAELRELRKRIAAMLLES